jgi:hypothetical protein
MEDYVQTLLPYASRIGQYAPGAAWRALGASAEFLTTEEGKPDLSAIMMSLVIVYLSLAIAGMATRWAFGMVRMVVRLVVLLAVVGGGLWCYAVGPEAAVEAVGRAWSGTAARRDDWEAVVGRGVEWGRGVVGEGH